MRNSSGRAFKDCKFRDKGREATITTYIVRREGEKIFHTIYKNHKSNLSENEKKKRNNNNTKKKKKKNIYIKKEHCQSFFVQMEKIYIKLTWIMFEY